MIVDTLTIVICGVLVVLAMMSFLADTFMRRVKDDGTARDDSTASVPVSVVVVADNNAADLEANLPSYLSQNYPQGFEVIVVVAKGDDGTADVLNSFGQRPNLYATFVPDSSRYMSRRKLAVTLGVRAARHEWILLTDATCRPLTDKWIMDMSSRCRDGVDIVCGYSNYETGTAPFRMFSLFHRQYRLACEALHGTAYGMAGRNLMFRKTMFMEGNGFQGNLKYLRGEYDFLVNKYAANDNVAVCLEPGSFLAEAEPTDKGWHDRNVFYCETRRHLKRSLRHRLWFDVDMLALYAGLTASLCAGVYASLVYDWVMLSVAVLSLVVPVVVRTACARRAMAVFGLSVPLIKIVPFELRLVWHNLGSVMAYKMADKYEFISHKS